MGESDKTPRRSAKKARCAIYTRKSSEEGLEQAFNSLDAQREACAAFILSQGSPPPTDDHDHASLDRTNLRGREGHH